MKYRKITIDLDLGDRIKHIEIDNEIELKEYYKMKNKIDELQQENEELKQTLHNITINGVEEENITVLDLIKENETLKAKLEIGKTCGFCSYYDYKSRCKRALHLIKHNDIYDYRVFEEKLENILQGSDEK